MRGKNLESPSGERRRDRDFSFALEVLSLCAIDTRVNDRGDNLRGGERSRYSPLARKSRIRGRKGEKISTVSGALDRIQSIFLRRTCVAPRGKSLRHFFLFPSRDRRILLSPRGARMRLNGATKRSFERNNVADPTRNRCVFNPYILLRLYFASRMPDNSASSPLP